MHGKQIIFVLCTFVILLGWSPVPAGNLTLVEKRITELDQVNKRIVRESVVLPANGIFHIRAHVQDTPNGPIFKLIDKQFSETREGIFPFKPGNQS